MLWRTISMFSWFPLDNFQSSSLSGSKSSSRLGHLSPNFSMPFRVIHFVTLQDFLYLGDNSVPWIRVSASHNDLSNTSSSCWKHIPKPGTGVVLRVREQLSQCHLYCPLWTWGLTLPGTWKKTHQEGNLNVTVSKVTHRVFIMTKTLES